MGVSPVTSIIEAYELEGGGKLVADSSVLTPKHWLPTLRLYLVVVYRGVQQAPREESGT